MKAVKLLYKEEGIYLGKPCDVPVPAEVVLQYGIGPLSCTDEHVKKFNVKGEIIEGILLGENEEYAEEFQRKHEVDEIKFYRKMRNMKRGKRFRTSSYHDYISESSYYEYKYNGEIYIVAKGIEFIPLWKWIEKDGKILPQLCGKASEEYYTDEGKNYFYYSGYSREEKFLKFDNDIPPIAKTFATNYGYMGYKDRDYRYSRFHWKEKNIFTCDPLPFPPYHIIGAVKLLPWERIMNKKENKLPKVLSDIYILKPILLFDEPAAVISLSEDKLKEFASHIQGDIFDPDSITEFPEKEYRAVFEISHEYILLCQPKWPF